MSKDVRRIAETGTADDVLLLDDDRYVTLIREGAAARQPTGIGSPTLAAEVVPFLHWEARLLDMRQYRAWLELLAPDVVYWVPAQAEGGDPRIESAINFDDRRRLIDRIALIETGALHPQIPPSRTCRLLTNVEAWPEANGRIRVRSNVAIWEYRRRRLASFVGWQEHELVQGPSHRLIRKKVVNLLECDQPQGNVTFIL